MAETGTLAAEVLLQRYGPDWSAHSDLVKQSCSGNCFDAIAVGTYLLSAYGELVSAAETSGEISVMRLAPETVADQTWQFCDTTAIGNVVDTTVPLSLVAGDSPLARLFFVTTDNGIYYSECTDIVNNAWGAPVLVVNPTNDVVAIAATRTTSLFYVTENSNHNRRLWHWDGNSVSGSAIYWPFSITGFDAVSVPNVEHILFSTDLPPLIGSRAVGTEVELTVETVQGIVGFTYANSRWSDWQSRDVIDRIPEDFDPARDNLRLSYYNDILFCTYTRAGGDSHHQYNKRAVMRSKDGVNWEFPEFVDSIQSPYVTIPMADYLYAVGVSHTLRSPNCAWAGQSDPVELDVTDRIVSVESQAADIRNSAVTMADPPLESTTLLFTGALDGTLALVDERLQLVYKLGYDVGGVTIRPQISVEDVMARRRIRNFEKLNTALQSRDRMGRVNRVRADGAFEWPSQQAGRDHYNDPTGTGYGGLRHTAPYEGSWKASNGILELVSSSKEGLAITTFVTDTLNGSAQTGILFEESGNGEYLGISFRVFDKDNLFFVAYYIDDDTFKLYSRTVVPGDDEFTDTLEATSSAMSWATEDTWYYLKVVVKYSMVYLYTSTDGQTWVAGTGEFAGGVELDGDTGIRDYPTSVWSGKFGLIGYGYSEDDDWDDWTPDPYPGPIDPDILDRPDIVFSREDTTAIFRTENWSTQSPAGPKWVDITDTLTDIDRIAIDQENRYIYAASSTNGIYRATVDSSTPSWTRILNANSLPECVNKWSPGIAITSDGYLGVPAMSTAACCNCTYNLTTWEKTSRPLMIIYSPTGEQRILHLTGTQCCPDHAAATAWAWQRTLHYVQSSWQTGINGRTLRWCQECRDAKNHTIYATPDDVATAQHTTEDDQGGGGSDPYYMLCDMGTYGFVTGRGIKDEIRKITFGSDALWEDMTPDDWPADGDWGAADHAHGFDRDAIIPFAVVTESATVEARLYKSTGSQFTTIVAESDLDNGIFRHCSCYCNNADQLFLATTTHALWTLDGGLAWIDRTGDMGAGSNELRAVWTKAPDA